MANEQRKMFITISHERNADQNHDETPLHTHNDGYHQKDNVMSVGDDAVKLELPYTTENVKCATTMDNSWAVPQKAKHSN